MGLTAKQLVEAKELSAKNEALIEAQGFVRQFAMAHLENGKWLCEILEETETHATIKVGLFGFEATTWFASVPSELLHSRQIRELALRNAGLV